MDELTVLGETVTVPAGVDPAVMRELAAALERQLLAQGGRGISDVTGVFVTTLARTDNGADVELTWVYNNSGDYDQNKEVNIGDLTPIGQYYHGQEGDANWNLAQVSDGDDNGEVNISDLSPIGANFFSIVDNYVVEADIDGAGDWRPVANVAFDAKIEPAGGGRLTFACTVANGIQVPVADVSAFRVSAGPEAAELYEFPGVSWYAALAPAALTGYQPLTVDFTVNFYDSTGPFDVDLDFDDGSAHYTGTSAAGEALAFSHTFDAAGTYNVSGSATNTGADGGAMNLAATITVEEYSGNPLFNVSNWATDTLEEGPNFGAYSAVALVNGMPVIAYVDVEDDEVMYARAVVAHPTGIADWAISSVEDGTDTITKLDVVECQGVPCIVWENQSDTDIYFAGATTATPAGPSDWTIYKPDNDGIKNPQIECLNNQPIMLYDSFGGLRFARSVAAGGLPAADTDWVTMDILTEDTQDFPSLAVVNGLPAVAYKHKNGVQDLCYIYADSAEPDLATNWTNITVDDTNYNDGNDIVLIDAGGLPAIGYSSFANTGARFLRYARATSATPGETDWELMTVRVEDQVHHGEMLGMAWYQDRPFMCYLTVYTAQASELGVSYPNIAHPTDTAHWDSDSLVVPSGFTISEQTHALVLADGTLAMVYRTTAGLRYSYYEP